MNLKQLYTDEEHDFCIGMEVIIEYCFETNEPTEKMILCERKSYNYLNEKNGYFIKNIPGYDKVRNKKLTMLIMNRKLK